MTNLVLVTHGQIGAELLHVAQAILEKKIPVTSISIELDSSSDSKVHQVRALVEAMSPEDRMIALTDSFGGTPSNFILPFLEPGRVEIVSGVNLGMLLHLATADLEGDLQEICINAKQAGQDAIVIAGGFL